jgi:2-keto-4-pentenoate hydratase/2-oxohepta-3-ene-1,7-dioic acid hydratase in catechol pathway
MRLLTFERDGGQQALGVRFGDEVVDLAPLGLPPTLDAMLAAGPDALGFAARAAADLPQRLRLSSLRLLPPISHPAKAIAVGLNYRDHAAEGQMAVPAHPVLFQRYPSSWVGHGRALVRPHVSTQFDYEGELVVVIGKAGRYLSKEQALQHVAGYSVFNDGSIRDHQLRTTQWMPGKNFDQSGGFGPEFVSADELPAGAVGLRLQTRLNGELLQDANTSDMIFDVATLVAACSVPFALQPGDIIISGTPAGVGFARKPQVFMKPGDVCEVEIEGVGRLSNPIVAEAA